MSSAAQTPFNLQDEEELTLITELLETEHARLLVGIRHTFHREYRGELHRRLELLERVLQRTAGGTGSV